MERPSTPSAGCNGHTTPQTPILSSLALTEYSSYPTPPPETAKATLTSVLPPDFLLPSGYPDYLRLILTSRVYEAIQETPLSHAVNLSNRLECNVLLKREDLQPVFSFKVRGAYNKMAHIDPNESWRGVIACSAGNHAQGVAYSARKLKIPATIVMPLETPDIKVRNVSRLGSKVLLHGVDFDAAKEEAHRLAGIHNLINIAPFDDPYVIAGQGTIGLELLRQTNLARLKAIFCCVGGGGLIAGVGVYVKRIAPHVKIIGVETSDANAMVQSLRAGKHVILEDVGLFADGAAVKSVGQETFRLCSEVVDEIIEVSTDEICAAIKDIFEDTRSIVEPAGALALAGLKKYAVRNPSQETDRGLVAILSGANMDFDRLRFVAERAAIGERKEALFHIRMRECPGTFAALIEATQPNNVTEFSYRFGNSEDAHILLGISVLASQHDVDLGKAIGRIEAAGFIATNLSSDELTKSHLRYMGGGRSNATSERLFMFEFPERRGALARFLTTLQPGFNISLFHYRNYGGDTAKVLSGIQCPPGEEGKLDGFLGRIGYPYREQTDNVAYHMFLRD